MRRVLKRYRDNHVGLNASTSKLADRFLVGPTRESVEQHAKYMSKNRDEGIDTFIPQMWTSHRMQIVHEFEWHRLVRAIEYEFGDERVGRFELNFGESDDDWYPPTVIIPTNLPEFSTGLELRGRTIILGMSEVPGFTDYSPRPFPWEREPDG